MKFEFTIFFSRIDIPNYASYLRMTDIPLSEFIHLYIDFTPKKSELCKNQTLGRKITYQNLTSSSNEIFEITA